MAAGVLFYLFSLVAVHEPPPAAGTARPESGVPPSPVFDLDAASPGQNRALSLGVYAAFATRSRRRGTTRASLKDTAGRYGFRCPSAGSSLLGAHAARVLIHELNVHAGRVRSQAFAKEV